MFVPIAVATNLRRTFYKFFSLAISLVSCYTWNSKRITHYNDDTNVHDDNEKVHSDNIDIIKLDIIKIVMPVVASVWSFQLQSLQ